jgi:glucokinase
VIHPIGSANDSEPVILEHAASGWAIAKSAKTRSMLSAQADRLTAEDVAHAATQGDRLALMVLDNAWSALAHGICLMIALLCPRRIVIGGGVALMGEELLFKPLRQKIAERVFKPFAGRFDIVPAALGEEVVVHGALVLARKRFSQSDK